MTISLKSLRGGSGSNGFSLLVGSSGNTTFTFDTDQPAGAYSVSSELSDTTFDIYLVTSGNESAGYTNSGALDAAAAFNRIVLYGGTENDILNFEFKTYTSPATKGDVADGAAPFLTSATPTTLASADDTTTVTGGNFAADVGISFIGQDTIVVPAKSVVRSSSTELIVTRPDAFPVAQEPFSMTATNAGITNPSVVVNKLTDYFDAGSGLVWVTTSPLAGFVTDSAYSDTLEATDVDGGAITYAVTTGSLPTGLSLNSATGVISGTPPGSAEETFTVTATDAGGNSSPREFLLPKLSLEVDYLVIAGGGGGGTDAEVGGSGGGGGLLTGTLVLFQQGYTVTVGSGGARGTGADQTGAGTGSNGTNGGNSVFNSLTAIGGGGGGTRNSNGQAGGSGGGGGDAPRSGGAGTAGQGFAGGNSGGTNIPNSNADTGAGGGAGGPATGSPTQSTPGPGLFNAVGNGTFAAGGGVVGIVGYVSGPLNSGNGGSGARPGGSGIVIIKYPDSYTITIGAGLTGTTPPAAGGFKVTTFTAGTDTISFA